METDQLSCYYWILVVLLNYNLCYELIKSNETINISIVFLLKKVLNNKFYI